MVQERRQSSRLEKMRKAPKNDKTSSPKGIVKKQAKALPPRGKETADSIAASVRKSEARLRRMYIERDRLVESLKPGDRVPVVPAHCPPRNDMAVPYVSMDAFGIIHTDPLDTAPRGAWMVPARNRRPKMGAEKRQSRAINTKALNASMKTTGASAEASKTAGR